MPHRIDIDGISRNLFILKHLAVGSQPLCNAMRIDRCDEEDKLFGWNYYIGWLKSIVCETLIETAIKFRILHDFLKAHPEAGVDVGQIESRTNAAYVVGRFVSPWSPLPIRETCNKIIHASDVSLVWLLGKDEHGRYEFWDGTVNLEGSKGGTHGPVSYTPPSSAQRWKTF